MSAHAFQAGCAVKPAIAMKPKTVSVNGVVISRSAIAREMQNHPAANPIEAWKAATRALVVRELLLQEAYRIGLTPQPQSDAQGRRETNEEALIRQVLEREVLTPEPDEESCRRYFEQNRARFRSPPLHEVAHILIPLPLEASAVEQAQAEALANTILSALAENAAVFEKLAREHSACPSREVGGSLGQIGPGETVPEFERALAALPVGCVAAKPVRSRYGLHIVRVDRRIDGQSLPFAVAKERIAAFLRDRVRHVAERQFLAILAGRARIEGVSFEKAATPLVQ